MAYTPTNWQTGDTITAQKLNKLENGVASGGDNFLVTLTPTGETTATSDKSSSEIIAAIKQGMLPFAVVSVNNEIVSALQYIRFLNANGTLTVRFGDAHADQTGEYFGTIIDVVGTTATMTHIEFQMQT